MPYPQKGPAVNLPLTGDAPVLGFGTRDGVAPTSAAQDYIDSAGNIMATGDRGFPIPNTGSSTAEIFLKGHPSLSRPDINVDLSGVSAVSINDLRLAFQIQSFLELNARSGSRYTEFILAHFGVRSADSRLQRPEYLGGGRSPVVFSEVLQTSSTDTTSPQANLAGHGFSAQRSHKFKRRFTEHGYIIGLMSVMPRTNYQQGIDRKFTRFTRFDYLDPKFVHLGEQGVLNKEIYVQGNSTDDELFGYQARYQEYRRSHSHVAADFRGTFDFWHLGRVFEAKPELNSSYLECTPSNRIFADTEGNEDNLWVQMHHTVRVLRQLPKVGVPASLF